MDIAVTLGQRFKKPLKIVDKKVNPTDKLKKIYEQLFYSKGKKLKEIDFKYNNIKPLGKFESPTSSNKRYYKYDLRSLKQKGIDELLVVNVKYGMLVDYYGMIELSKSGYCQIKSQIVNLSDNSILFKDSSKAAERIKGKWKTPPKYKSLQNAISAAITKVMTIDKDKFN